MDMRNGRGREHIIRTQIVLEPKGWDFVLKLLRILYDLQVTTTI